MKRKTTLALILTPLLAVAFNATSHAADEAAETPQYLFVHNAAGLESSGGKIVMKGVDAKTIFFSDRPDRIAGHTPTEQFVKEWAVGDDNFAENNPNAVLAVFAESGAEPEDIVVTLSNPVLSDGNLSYDVKVLEGTIPASGGECTLFIDIIGRPMTPLSVAGVARRTTRRRVIFGTAALAGSAAYAAPQPTTVVVNTPPPPPSTTTVVTQQAPAPAPAPAKTPEQRLSDLQDLLTKGLITQSEYDAKRQAILAEL